MAGKFVEVIASVPRISTQLVFRPMAREFVCCCRSHPRCVAGHESVRVPPANEDVILVGYEAVVLGIVVGAVVSLFFPVPEGANYELGQAAGLMAVVGGAIGLVVGALLSLLLGAVAGRKRGAALAVQTDVR